MAGAERVILCGGIAKPSRLDESKVLRLSLGEGDHDIRLHIENITDRLITGLPDCFIDLIEIASYVYAADQGIKRNGDGFGSSWRRTLRFRIPVRQPELWMESQVNNVLTNTLSILSEDTYAFDFVPNRKPTPIKSYLNLQPSVPDSDDVEEVVLFSGGLDSLGGAAAEAVRDNRRVALVSHRANPLIHSKQRALVEGLRSLCRGDQILHVPVWVQKGKGLDREFTQRSRSFLFAALAAAVASVFGKQRIRFYENGVVSLNTPISEQVVGSRATRTTHPQVLNGFAALLSLLTGQTFKVENPFLWLTKTDVVNLVGDTGCGQLIEQSVSCTRSRTLPEGWTHCGVCSQCISRRFATLASRYAQLDPDSKYRVDLLAGSREDTTDQTMLESFIRTSMAMATMRDDQLVEQCPDLARVLGHLKPMTADEAAQRILDLYRRFSKEVTLVLSEGWKRHADQILRQELPRSCGMIMAFPEAYRTSSVNRSQGEARGGSLKAPARVRLKNNFLMPEGTRWEDMTLRFLDGNTVKVVVGEIQEIKSHAEMNMSSMRNGNPTKQWELLAGLARTHGALSWSSSQAGAKAKKRVQLLGKQLSDYFGIPESPFYPYLKGKGWQLRLKLEEGR